MKTWLNDREAGAHIGISPSTLEKWRKKGRGPKFSKLGFYKTAPIRYLLKDLDAWMVKYRVETRESA